MHRLSGVQPSLNGHREARKAHREQDRRGRGQPAPDGFRFTRNRPLLTDDTDNPGQWLPGQDGDLGARDPIGKGATMTPVAYGGRLNAERSGQA